MNSKEVATLAAEAAADKKASDIIILEIGQLLGITDYFVICSGQTDRQVKIVADNIRKKLGETERKPFSVAGETEGQWVLMDYGDVVIHIFTAEQREYYQLERLWKDAPMQRVGDRTG